MCHLWLLVVTRLSVWLLGSSLSLLINLSWRALRLLSRAASSSSSSFLANLRQAKKPEKWEGISWGKRKEIFFPKPSSPSSLPQFRNFKENNPLNWAVIITVTEPEAPFFFFFLRYYRADLSAVQKPLLLIVVAAFVADKEASLAT